jgi:hypothetical protein
VFLTFIYTDTGLPPTSDTHVLGNLNSPSFVSCPLTSPYLTWISVYLLPVPEQLWNYTCFCPFPHLTSLFYDSTLTLLPSQRFAMVDTSFYLPYKTSSSIFTSACLQTHFPLPFAYFPDTTS